MYMTVISLFIVEMIEQKLHIHFAEALDEGSKIALVMLDLSEMFFW